MFSFGGKSHRSTIASTRSSLFIICSTGMPRQPYQDRSIRSIIVVVLLLKPSRNLVVHLLVIFLLGSENALRLACRSGEKRSIALGIEVISSPTKRESCDANVYTRGRRLRRFGGV